MHPLGASEALPEHIARLMRAPDTGTSVGVRYDFWSNVTPDVEVGDTLVAPSWPNPDSVTVVHVPPPDSEKPLLVAWDATIIGVQCLPSNAACVWGELHTELQTAKVEREVMKIALADVRALLQHMVDVDAVDVDHELMKRTLDALSGF